MGHRRAGAQPPGRVVVRRGPRPGAPDRQGAEREAGGVVHGASGSIRRAGVGGAAASRSGRRTARGSRRQAGLARRRHRRPRRRRSPLVAEVRSVLGEGRAARRARLRSPRRRRQRPQGRRAARARRPRQHHRQPARDDGLLLADDLRRDARSVSAAEVLRRPRAAATCRRISGAPTSRATRAPTPTARTRSTRGNTSRDRSSPTRWCSATKACGTWWRRWA